MLFNDIIRINFYFITVNNLERKFNQIIEIFF